MPANTSANLKARERHQKECNVIGTAVHSGTALPVLRPLLGQEGWRRHQKTLERRGRGGHSGLTTPCCAFKGGFAAFPNARPPRYPRSGLRRYHSDKALEGDSRAGSIQTIEVRQTVDTLEEIRSRM